MRYLLAFYILAWVGCTTPVLEIEELEKEDIAVSLDFSYVVYTDDDNDLFIQDIATGDLLQINRPNINVIDFEVVRSRNEIIFMVNESPYDSLLTYNFNYQRITTRRRLYDTYDGMSVTPGGRTFVWAKAPSEIEGVDDNLNLRYSDLDFADLYDVIFYDDDRFAFFYEINSQKYFGYRDVNQGMLSSKVFYNEYGSAALSSNGLIFYTTGHNVSNQRFYLAASSSLGDPQEISVNIGNYFVWHVGFHPVDNNRVYLWAKGANDYSDVRLIQLDLTSYSSKTVLKTGEISRYTREFMLY